MHLLLQGKVAVVSGAGQRIGREACFAFARHGARIVAADLNPAAVEATAAQVRDRGGKAIAFAGDVADPLTADALVAAAVRAFGRLDILLNNSGVVLRPRAVGPSAGKVRRRAPALATFYSVNVDGLRTICQAALRCFEKQGGGGTIVNTDLIARLIDYGNVRYDPRDSAVATLTRELALTAAEHGTRVNAFCPAGMASMMAEGNEPEDLTGAAGSVTPLGRAVTAEACANAALFLASDLAETVTGVNLPVDGGLAAQRCVSEPLDAASAIRTTADQDRE